MFLDWRGFRQTACAFLVMGAKISEVWISLLLLAEAHLVRLEASSSQKCFKHQWFGRVQGSLLCFQYMSERDFIECCGRMIQMCILCWILTHTHCAWWWCLQQIKITLNKQKNPTMDHLVHFLTTYSAVVLFLPVRKPGKTLRLDS